VTGVLPLAVAALLCAGPSPGDAGDLRDVDAAWAAAVASRDQAAFLSRVAPDAVFAGSALQVGREAIREKWARYFVAGGPTLRWKPTDSGVAPSGDLGWTIGDAVFEWKEKGAGPSLGRYVTVWALGGDGRWMAVLDAPLEPSPPEKANRRAVRTITSRDGSLEASIGTWERGEGPSRATGAFLSVRERQGGAWHGVIDSEVVAPPGK
jgi:ketosteroid isomerase-like protein